MSRIIESSVKEVDKILKMPFGAEPFTFLIGLFVLKLVADIILYWDGSSANCKFGANELCSKTATSLQLFINNAITVFSVVYFGYLIGGGIRKHGLDPRAFIPYAAIIIIVRLLVWFLRDVIALMKDSSQVINSSVVNIIQKDIYSDVNVFSDESYSIYSVLAGLIVGLV
jgi:hypothetical protein